MLLLLLLLLLLYAFIYQYSVCGTKTKLSGVFENWITDRLWNGLLSPLVKLDLNSIERERERERDWEEWEISYNNYYSVSKQYNSNLL